MMTSQIEVMSRYLTLMEPNRKAIPRDKRYSSMIAGIASNQAGLGVIPLIKVNMMITPRLMSILMTAVRVDETTTMYFGKLIFLSKSPRTMMD